MAPIPNVSPTTSILIITTILLGVKYGIIQAVLTMVVSNLILGMGIWTMPQIVSLSVIALVTGILIRPLFSKIPFWAMALYTGMAGLLYGFVISLAQIPLYGFKYFVSYYLAGLSFDMMHAAGNIGFYIVLAPILFPLLDKLLVRYVSGMKLNH